MRCNSVSTHSRFPLLSLVAALAMVCAGCSNVEKAKPTSTSVRPDRSIKMDVPEIMSGTVGSETVVLGYDDSASQSSKPIIARGYGLVVGLNGTGSRDIPPQLRAHMLAEASRGGFGSERLGPKVGEISPEQLLNSPDTAVVVVEAIIPQGAVKGSRFDVRVYADPRTGTTSLEGGRLYTTRLRPGPLTSGTIQAMELAQANGPIFVNPFAEPGAVGRDTINRTIGRILNGGAVVKDMPIKLRLANPSHTRASILQSAINTRFPIERGQHDPTARGESDELIELTVPPSFADRTGEFIDLLKHTTIRQSNPESVANSIKRALLANPLVARAASLRWQALGKRVLPLIKDLYSDPEEIPRLAALRAGAKLDDALVIPELTKMAKSGSPEARIEAIQLLGGMSSNPQIDVALRGLLDDDDVEVRLETYESLVKRNDPYMNRFEVDRKYVVDVVDSAKPLIYITQIGMPRIVIFGRDMAIDRPITLAAWSNRFMIKADLGDQQVEVYYRRPEAEQGQISRVDPSMSKFAMFLGHTTTIDRPAPGLGLSYGETVGAIHQLWSQKFVHADFRAEQDRILAAIRRQQSEEAATEREDFTTDESPVGETGAVSSDLGRIGNPSPVQPDPGSNPKAELPQLAPKPD